MLNLGLHLEPGMKVGLYGGTFDPPHAAHLNVARTALKRLGLDRVVWLVSPQNPLKARRPAPTAERMAAIRRLADGPAMSVSDLEDRLGARYTVETVRALKRRYPGVRFVWIMGADSLAGLHRWKAWTEIARALPIAVVGRPGWGARARLAPAPRRLAHARLRPGSGRRLPFCEPPCWIDLATRLDPLSSTQLRG